jgi:photosystem II stability/assembly factor-like uncharacterized protein
MIMKLPYLFLLLPLLTGCGGGKPSPSVAEGPLGTPVSNLKKPLTPPEKEPEPLPIGAGSWALQERGVHFLDGQLGFAVGHANTILRTSDGGKTWARVIERKEGGTSTELRDVVFTSSKVGWVKTAIIDVILHTTDGGETWTKLPLPGPEGVYSWQGQGFCAHAAVGNTYWILYWGLHGPHLARTDSAGKDWQITKLKLDIPGGAGAGLSFADAKNGCVSWKPGAQKGGQVAITENGGQTWRAVELKEGKNTGGNWIKCQILNPRVAFALPHYGTIHYTNDAGHSWGSRDLGHVRSGDLMGLHFVDATFGHVLISHIPKAEVRRTLDGGKTWRSLGKLKNPDHVHSLSFPESQNGWVVGDQGYIEHYEEGK